MLATTWKFVPKPIKGLRRKTPAADRPSPSAPKDAPAPLKSHDAPALRGPLGLVRDAAYALVRTVGDGVLLLVSGPSDPVVKRRTEIAELRAREMAQFRQKKRQQMPLWHSRSAGQRRGR
jgi:hypothetical protein